MIGLFPLTPHLTVRLARAWSNAHAKDSQRSQGVGTNNLKFLYIKVDKTVAGSNYISDIEGTGGKSELHRTQCSVTRSPGDGKESATENIPSRLLVG